MSQNEFLEGTEQRAMAELAAATQPAALIEGGQWNPLVIPMLPDARGDTLTIGRTFQFDAEGLVFGYALGQQLGGFPTHEEARAAVEERARPGPTRKLREALFRLKTEAEIAGLSAKPGWDAWVSMANEALGLSEPAERPDRDEAVAGRDLAAADILASLVSARRFMSIIDQALVDEILAKAERAGLRAQSFVERERDLLAANNRLLERARTAEGQLANAFAMIEKEQDRSMGLIERLASREPLPRVRHLKRGSIYEVLGEAEAQISTGYPGPDHAGYGFHLAEGDKLVVYRGLEDGKLWLRAPEEFADGRFADADQKHPNGAPMWAADGTLLDDKGKRSVFDDVDK